VFLSKGYVDQPGLPLIVSFWILLPLIFFRDRLYNFLARHFPRIKVGEFELDEDLENYFLTLDHHDRNWSIKEEEACRNVLRMPMLTDDTFENLKNHKSEGKEMQGVHTYDILANPNYYDDFQYFSSDLEDRGKYIIDDDEDESNDNAQSDLVRIILNLAFLTPGQARGFTFDKNTYSQQLKGIIPSETKYTTTDKSNAIN